MNRTTLDIIFGCIAAYYLWKHILRPKTLSYKAKVKEYRKHLTMLHCMNSDIYSDKLCQELIGEIAKCDGMMAEKDKNVINKFMAESQERLKKTLPKRKFSSAAENLDILLVAFSLAFAVRALFLQPFKIPTGSMQPTLHGVNVYEPEEQQDIDRVNPNRVMAQKTDSGLRYFLNALYYGQSYSNIITENGGHYDGKISSPSKVEVIKNKGIPFLEDYSKISIGGTPYYL
ncbi:MAG: S26 family signal peptidase, partial [Lentisphaeraceae bacterium]|nr:S26 family signal peptidase [Lentisphaeraceae bacterium]